MVDFSDEHYNLGEINFVLSKGDIKKSCTPSGDEWISFLNKKCMESGMTFLLPTGTKLLPDNTQITD